MAIFNLFSSNDRHPIRGGGGTVIGGMAKQTKSGQSVTTANAMEDATVLSCVNVIAQGIAQLPLNLVSKADSSVSKSPISSLSQRPNDYQTPYEFTYGLVATLLTYGNAYLKIVRTANGRPVQLLPMDPTDIMYALNVAKMPVYSYRGSNERISNDEIIHIKDTVLFDVEGMSRVTLAATRVGALKAADELMEDTFRNGVNIMTSFEFPEYLDANRKEDFLEGVKQSFTAAGPNRGGSLLLEMGVMKQHKGTTAADTDLRELRLNLIHEIAAVFRVPSFMVGGSGDQKYSNVRQMQTALYRDTFAPILTSIEQSFNMKLLSKSYDECFKFDVTELLKGDVESQANVAAKLVDSGIWTANEARAYTGMEALEGGDVLGQVSSLNANDYRGTEGQPNAMAPENTGEENNNE